MERWLGGSPLGVAIRLIILSIVVGIVLSAMGITPDNVFYKLQILIKRLYDLGFGAIDWLIGYFVIGAIIVVPIWLIIRLMSGLRGGADNPRS
ncbi:MAG: integrase [Hyphomicrobiaceae bacterium TMED74]|nr:integrase [Filomicrobium sp.]RPG44428.1 MAG: integrase [Hyphomicrobiaceae bacterium TMED74]